jgi:DNA-binding transcriptional ArsR family regulator
MRIVYVLVDSAEDVSHLARVIDKSVPEVSRQLKILRNANLVRVRRNKKQRIYSLSDLIIVRREGDRVLVKLEVLGDSVELGAREAPQETPGRSPPAKSRKRSPDGVTPSRRVRLV